MRIGLTWTFLLLLGLGSHAQPYTLTGGFQVKPILASSFLRTGPQTDSVNFSRFTVTQTPGFSLGFTLKNQFKERLSLEFGLLMSQRNFRLAISDSTMNKTSDFRFNSFEIPVLLQTRVSLNKTNDLQGAIGLNFNLTNRDYNYPALTAGLSEAYYKNYLSRHFGIMPGIMGNLGWQKELKNGHSTYIGASLSLPFSWLYKAYVTHQDDLPPFAPKAQKQFDLRGNYLTLDLRYYLIKDRTDLVYKPGGYGEY
jgi:hypothetical protein